MTHPLNTLQHDHDDNDDDGDDCSVGVKYR